MDVNQHDKREIFHCPLCFNQHIESPLDTDADGVYHCMKCGYVGTRDDLVHVSNEFKRSHPLTPSISSQEIRGRCNSGGFTLPYFDYFISNTIAGCSNQGFFSTKGNWETGRILIKIQASGDFPYSLLFSNILDSTYADGSSSRCNQAGNTWEIGSARLGKISSFNMEPVLADPAGEFSLSDPENGWRPLTFGGKSTLTVTPGMVFSSDPIAMTFEAGEYLCLEMTYRGNQIPCHHESILPVFKKGTSGWLYCPQIPLPGMTGCHRPVKKRVVFLGDSITQGIGTVPNTYTHWSAVLSRMLGTDYAFWNLGIGCGRAQDAATDGAWLQKAKHCDAAVVCFGVNDIFQVASAKETITDLKRITDILHASGVKVLLQTVPPFDYDDFYCPIWEEINQYIRNTMCEKADGFFDNIPILSQPGQPHIARFGGHPDEEGCKLWAEALYPEMLRLLNNPAD